MDISRVIHQGFIVLLKYQKIEFVNLLLLLKYFSFFFFFSFTRNTMIIDETINPLMLIN